MNDREAWVTSALVELADTLVSDFDLTELLATLVARCAELLDAAEVGVVLLDQHDTLQVMASSSERMRALELLEIQNAEGPCLDCVRTGQVVDAVTLDAAARQRWPGFVPEAVGAGYRQVLALPMRLRGRVIGAVNVFASHERTVPPADLRVGQALADAATIGILQDRAVQDQAHLVTQLQGALNSRIVIEQAKGMLAEAHHLSVDAAFELLRTHSRENNRRLSDVARSIARRDIPPEAVLPRSR